MASYDPPGRNGRAGNGASPWRMICAAGCVFICSIASGLGGCLYHEIDNHQDLQGHPAAIARIDAVETAVIEIRKDVRHNMTTLASMDTRLGIIVTKLDRLITGNG